MKEFLYAQNGLAIYEALSFDVQRKGVPTLHLFSTEVSARTFFFFNLFFWTLVTAARVANVASTLLLPMLVELRGELPPHRSRGLFVRRAPPADEQAWTQKEAR